MIEVCRTGPCAISGGEKIIEYLQESLGIRVGETTADEVFTLREVECLGSCGSGPVLQVNTEYYEKLTPEKVDKLLGELRESANKDKPDDSKWVEKFS